MPMLAISRRSALLGAATSLSNSPPNAAVLYIAVRELQCRGQDLLNRLSEASCACETAGLYLGGTTRICATICFSRALGEFAASAATAARRRPRDSPAQFQSALDDYVARRIDEQELGGDRLGKTVVLAV